MAEQRTHGLFIVGENGVDAVQVARGRVDADHRRAEMVVPVFHKIVILDNGNCSGERIAFKKLQFRFPDAEKMTAGNFQSFLKLFQQFRPVVAASMSRHDNCNDLSVLPVSEPQCNFLNFFSCIFRDLSRPVQRTGNRGSGIAGLFYNVLDAASHFFSSVSLVTYI